MRRKRAEMTPYLKVAQALVTAGYLSSEDVNAAAAVLVNTMRVADAQKAKAAAIDDEIYQESVIASARAEIAAAAEMGAGDQAYRRSVIEAAEDREDEDKATINSTQAIMAAAYDDAAAGLAAAGLVDGASVEARGRRDCTGLGDTAPLEPVGLRATANLNRVQWVTLSSVPDGPVILGSSRAAERRETRPISNPSAWGLMDPYREAQTGAN